MKYWIYLNNEKSGPYSVEQLIEKTIPPTTLVWCDGMPAWLPANEIAELMVISPKTVYTRLSRGKNLLLQSLKGTKLIG